jgi:hypothetical protein
MRLLVIARNALACGGLALASVAVGQTTNYLANGTEYPIAGLLRGDQALPQMGLGLTGGYLVWQDSITDGDSLGISALRLDSGFSGMYSPFRVNSRGAGPQENPQVSLLKGGGAAFVWQGGAQGFQHIYARFVSPNDLWVGEDVQVNTFPTNAQVNPVVATLANSNVVVAWSSFNQASSTSLQDIYAQVLSPTGHKIGGEVAINQYTSFNQRSPSIAALSDGRFVVAWVSEQQRFLEAAGNTTATYGTASVDIYGRIFSAGGAPVGDEFLISTNSRLCSAPRVAAGAAGSFMVVWSERGRVTDTNGWDIAGAVFNSAGVGGPARYLNTTRYGDQYLPSLSWDGMDYLVVWTSLGQDGSREGIYGQFLHDDGSLDQGEFRVNSTWISQQIQPAVASDGQGRFLAAWTSYGGGDNGFDLYAQRYVNVTQPLQAMGAPFVYVPFSVNEYGYYVPVVQVCWPLQAGLPVDHYDVYVNGALAATLTTNVWVMTAGPGSTNKFQVDYVTTSGRRSPISAMSTAVTWSGYYWDGIPNEWMARYFGGNNSARWPLASALLAPGGPTVLQAFLTGANPTNSATWLRTSMSRTTEGYMLNWNSQPGLTYQVQSSTNLQGWQNVGSQRFALGYKDSFNVGLSRTAYYRVMWLP